MTDHLSSQQFAEWIVSECDPATEDHLLNCPICRSELALFRKSLALFQRTAHHWAGEQKLSEARITQYIRLAPYRRVMNAISVTAAIVICLLGALSRSSDRIGSAVADAHGSDAALLQRIDREVTQAVPSSLTPLVSLISWETSGSLQE